MAEKEKKVVQTSEPPVASTQGEKPGGIVQSIIVVLLALLVVAMVTFGVFYFAVKNNINGLANILLPQIKDNPVLRIALPAELIPADADDPKNLSQKDLIKKYEDYRSQAETLKKSLEQANQTIEQLKKEAGSTKDAEAILQENQAVLKSIEDEKAKVEADKKAVSELAARGDLQGFRDYFEKVDKATAEAVYKEILTQEAIAADKAALSKPFSNMTPESAALVLAELFKQDKETLLDIFEGLKTNTAALILEQMDAKTAAEITKLLSDRKSR